MQIQDVVSMMILVYVANLLLKDWQFTKSLKRLSVFCYVDALFGAVADVVCSYWTDDSQKRPFPSVSICCALAGPSAAFRTWPRKFCSET